MLRGYLLRHASEFQAGGAPLRAEDVKDPIHDQVDPRFSCAALPATLGFRAGACLQSGGTLVTGLHPRPAENSVIGA